MRNLNNEWNKRIIRENNLIKYGFIKKNNTYFLEKPIFNNRFNVIVKINKEKKEAQLIDITNNEEYILVDIKTVLGSYNSKIKEEYDNLIEDIKNKCTSLEVFQNKETKIIMNYIKDNYHDNIEFLWKNLDSGIFRNKVNDKWYALMMQIPENRLKGTKDNTIEIINLHYYKDKTSEVIDYKNIFPAYHMNKKSWISIILDSNLDINKLYNLVNISYELSLKK